MSLWSLPALATGTLLVSIVSKGKATVTLVAQDQSKQIEIDEDGDGELRIAPNAGAGPYRITITVGDVSETASVDVPLTGQMRVIFNPSATPRIQAFALLVEEVTVTAQRVEASLQKTPVAVTVLSSRDIEVQRIVNVQQLAEETPNLWMEKNTITSSGSRAAIRGVGEDESMFTSDTPVGIYIDDVFIPRQTGAQFDLYEMERVEVLRGPQGTLFGRNTSAGAIRLITKQPGNNFEANADVTFGNYTQTDFRGSINAPMGSKASLQVATMVRKRDGYDLNTTNNQRVNDQGVFGGRASLRLLPAKAVNILISGDYLHEWSSPGFAAAFVPQPPFVSGYGVGELDLTQQLDGDNNIRTVQSDLPNPTNEIDQAGGSATITWAASNRANLKSVSAFRKMDSLLVADADGRVGNFLNIPGPGGVPAPTFHLFQDQSQHQFSQEIQIQGQAADQFRYLAGFYYFNEFNRQRTENAIFNPIGKNNYWDVNLTTHSTAAYANGTYQVSSQFTISAGARYTRDRKAFDTILFLPTGQQAVACTAGGVILGSRPCGAADPSGATTVGVEQHLEPTWSGFTPRVGVDFALNKNVMVYASASRGFKSGGFDGRANTAAQILGLQPIAPETLWAYEAGVKSDLFNNRARLNLAAFFNDWNDLQGNATDASGNFHRYSIGDVDTKGVELEGKLVPTKGLEFSGQLALLHTNYQTVNFNQVADCTPLGTATSKLELKYSPHTSYRIGGTYMLPVELAGGRWSGGSSVAGKSKFFHTQCNAEVGSEDGYTLADVFLAYETNNGAWRVTLAAENLTNEEYIGGSFSIAGLRMAVGFMNPPRRVSLSLRYAYR